jgi:hypothetical protein
MLDEDIRAYYDRGGERTRLDGSLELVRTKVLLERLLPAPPASVLDVGGAFGVYAGWLAERGHPVKIVDPIPLHVESARANGFTAEGATPAHSPTPTRAGTPSCCSARSTTSTAPTGFARSPRRVASSVPAESCWPRRSAGSPRCTRRSSMD